MVFLVLSLLILVCVRIDRKERELDERIINYYFRSIR